MATERPLVVLAGPIHPDGKVRATCLEPRACWARRGALGGFSRGRWRWLADSEEQTANSQW